MRLGDADELAEHRLAFGKLDDRFADVRLEIDAENRARGVIRRPDPKVRLERYDARGEAREDHLELAPLALDLLLALPRVLAGSGEPLRHVVERMHEEPDLVAGRRRHARGEVSARDGSRALHQQLNRRYEPPREKKRAVDGSQQRDQQHEAQRQRESGLQRRAQIRQLRDLVVTALNRVRERARAAAPSETSPARTRARRSAVGSVIAAAARI